MVGTKDLFGFMAFIGPGQMMSIRAVLVVFELAIMTQIQDPKVALDAAVSCVSHTKRQAGIVWQAMHEDRVPPQPTAAQSSHPPPHTSCLWFRQIPTAVGLSRRFTKTNDTNTI